MAYKQWSIVGCKLVPCQAACYKSRARFNIVGDLARLVLTREQPFGVYLLHQGHLCFSLSKRLDLLGHSLQLLCVEQHVAGP